MASWKLIRGGKEHKPTLKNKGSAPRQKNMLSVQDLGHIYQLTPLGAMWGRDLTFGASHVRGSTTDDNGRRGG